MQLAEQRAERARAEVTRAKAAVSAHGDVLGRIAAWNAKRQENQFGPMELPPDLARARPQLTASQDEHEHAERMLQLLERKAQQLRTSANVAAADLRTLITTVSRAEASGHE